MDASFWTDVFTGLGKKLENFGGDAVSQNIISEAVEENQWFTQDSIPLAVKAIKEEMLDREKISRWLSRYAIPAQNDPQGKVNIIMAGNIPAVGFFDMMCGLVCGYECHIKTSRKDSVVIWYLINILKEIYPEISIFDTPDKTPDKLLAMGSDNTARILSSTYPGIPSLIRANRSSAAILSGNENDDDLAALSNDIFSHCGLGCRNVSHLLLPEGYDPELLAKKLLQHSVPNAKYLNNYRQNKALAVMQARRFIDGGFFTLSESPDFPVYISDITYSYYNNEEQSVQWLATNRHNLQCVVSGRKDISGAVPFGRAQYPGLTDYPDGRDVMAFLLEE